MKSAVAAFAAAADDAAFPGIPPERLWEWARDIVKGLAYMHRQGVAHRDIKPENVLLCGGGAAQLCGGGAHQTQLCGGARIKGKGSRRKGYGFGDASRYSGDRAVAKLADFGSSLLLPSFRARRGDASADASSDASADAARVDGGGFLATDQAGTPAFMSPECASGEPHAPMPCDAWGFGATVFYALFARPPFEAPNAVALVETVAAAERVALPKPLDELYPANRASFEPNETEVAAAERSSESSDAESSESSERSERGGSSSRSPERHSRNSPRASRSDSDSDSDLSDDDSDALAAASSSRRPLRLSALRALLSGCLERDPARRLRASDLLAHPWLTRDGASPMTRWANLRAMLAPSARERAEAVERPTTAPEAAAEAFGVAGASRPPSRDTPSSGSARLRARRRDAPKRRRAERGAFSARGRRGGCSRATGRPSSRRSARRRAGVRRRGGASSRRTRPRGFRRRRHARRRGGFREGRVRDVPRRAPGGGRQDRTRRAAEARAQENRQRQDAHRGDRSRARGGGGARERKRIGGGGEGGGADGGVERTGPRRRRAESRRRLSASLRRVRLGNDARDRDVAVRGGRGHRRARAARRPTAPTSSRAAPRWKSSRAPRAPAGRATLRIIPGRSRRRRRTLKRAERRPSSRRTARAISWGTRALCSGERRA